MLLQERCEQLVFTQDADLLSRGGYRVACLDEPDQLWWSLDLLHESLVSRGEKRSLYRWVCFVRHGVEQTRMLSDLNTEQWLHTNSNSLPEGALKANVATSKGIIAFMAFQLKDGRTASLLEFCRLWLPQICNKAMRVVTDVFEVSLANMLPLEVHPGGFVEGLGVALSSRHSMVLQAWQTEWALMQEAGVLNSSFDDVDRVLLADLVRFCFEVERKRRSAGKHLWPSVSPSGQALLSVQCGLVSFLANCLDTYVLDNFVRQHDCSGVVPSRRRHGAASSSRVSMPPDSIFELITAAKESGLSAREGLTFLANSGRLSACAGCHPNVIDSWIRRCQTIYDERCVVAMAGANHLNLISDASKHSGKEVLVTVAWSWENQTAAMCNLQVILPLESIAPQEIELTSLVEKLAQARMTKSGLFCYAGLVLSFNMFQQRFSIFFIQRYSTTG